MDGVTSSQIFPLFWKAVAILELTCKLKVIATVSDGASQNRAFYKMHALLSNEDNPDLVTFKTKNIYAPDRYIWFFCDAPHLIKTTRNCLSNSGMNKCTRYMWDNGYNILWSHILQLYFEDAACDLQYFPKLTRDHICLTPYSVMNVRLAAQVLSESVAKNMEEYRPPEALETAKFIGLMDRFFDCCNVRNTKEGEYKRKEFLKPYANIDDERFHWLENIFLKYFPDWKENIQIRPGNFNIIINAKSKMFLSWQTHEGLIITSKL